MALGAERSAILKMILRDVLVCWRRDWPRVFLAALVLTRFLAHLLFEVDRPISKLRPAWL